MCTHKICKAANVRRHGELGCIAEYPRCGFLECEKPAVGTCKTRTGRKWCCERHRSPNKFTPIERTRWYLVRAQVLIDSEKIVSALFVRCTCHPIPKKTVEEPNEQTGLSEWPELVNNKGWDDKQKKQTKTKQKPGYRTEDGAFIPEEVMDESLWDELLK